MSQETANLALGALILIILLPILYIVGRVMGTIGDVWSARILAPMAPAIDGTVDRSPPCIRGSYLDREVRVSFTPGQNVGSGDSAMQINAFYIEVSNVPGRQDWRIKFYTSGVFGQSPNQLYIEVQDKALGERLDRSGVLAVVATVSAPTQSYVTVAYEVRRQTLTYTDDVSPHRIPSHDHFVAQLELVMRLAVVNEQVNPL